ncbi:MAG: lactonase family protein [Bryobacteraceae bacterium]
MQLRNARNRFDSPGVVSRRGLLKGAAVLAAAGSSPAPAQLGAVAKRGDLLYIGAYTGNGKGIYLFHMNLVNGSLTQLAVFPTSNPSWVALHPSKKYLYAVGEDAPGTVSAFSVQGDGTLVLLNTVPSMGSAPAHLSVDPFGKNVLVANYSTGNVAVLPIQANGGLLPAVQVVVDMTYSGLPVGPLKATDAPVGSFAISGHDAAHAHMIMTDPSGKYAFVADLGLDAILIFKYNPAGGANTLSLNSPNYVKVPPGDGPRHFAFSPTNPRRFYSIQEEADTIEYYTFDPATGTLTTQQIISSMPPGFVGTNFTSEIRVSADGRFVYGANRLHDTIAWFRIDSGGDLVHLGEVWTRGDYPRSFTIDPTGRFMYVCNQRGDSVTIFNVDPSSGALTFTGEYVPVGSPAVVQFL